MKKLICFIFLISSIAQGQKISSRLNFQQGQDYQVEMTVKSTISQQAMGQSIDIDINANAIHDFKVTNSTEDNTTLNHSIRHISFLFDGMGQKKNFDSDLEKDQNSQSGKPVMELLSKKYDIIIDTSGKTMVAVPEKIQLSAGNNQMAFISGMLKEIFTLVQPPAKGTACFFKVLPDTGAVFKRPWTESYINESGKFDAAYTISDINDSTIVVDFAANSVTVSKLEMMGGETTTTLNNKSTGKIILDRSTGIMKEKTFETNSSGNAETSFGTLPLTSKTTTTIRIKNL
jgi:hypothetical protein